MKSNNITNYLYSICKKITKSDWRNSINKLLSDLNRGDNSIFGYLARKRTLQFLSYLQLHVEYDRINKLPIPLLIHPLNNDSIKLFEEGHNFLSMVNQHFLKKVEMSFPSLGSVIDPYSKYNYKMNTNIDNKYFSEFFNSEELDNIFNMSSPLRKIIKIIEAFPDLKKQQLDSFRLAMETLVKKIQQNGIDYIPREISDFPLFYNKQSIEYAKTIFLFSLVAINSSLFLIDQLLYTAFNLEKLPILNNENVFNIKKNGKNIIGEYLITESQPIGMELFSDPGDVILVKVNMPNYSIDSLFIIENSSISFAGEFGNVQRFEMRKLDSSLCPFSGLITSFDL